MKSLFVRDNLLIWETPYNKEEVRALKQALSSAKWNPDHKVWEISPDDKKMAVALAERFSVEVDSSVAVMGQEAETTTGKADLHADMIRCVFVYSQQAVVDVKKIPGAKWKPNVKCWLIPKVQAKRVVEWAEKYGIEVHDKIKDIAASQAMRGLRNLAMSTAETADIDLDFLKMEPHPYQMAGVLYSVENRRNFIADDMGLGKTLQALAAIEYTKGHPALIVVPANLVIDWQYKIEDVLGERSVQIILGRNEEQTIEDTQYTIVGYPNIFAHKDLLKSYPWKSVVFDESHYLKGPKSQRTKAAKAIVKNKNINVWMLTGTPVKNRPAEYVPQLEILGKIDIFGDAWRFYKRYCNAKRGRFGWDIKGSSNLEELQAELRKHCYIRREKDDVLQDLPPKTYSTVVTPLSDSDYKRYQKELIEFRNWYREDRSATDVLGQMATLRRLCGEGKIDHAIEWVKNANEQGNKVVIVAHHRDVVNTISEATGGLHIIGGQNPREVEHMKALFMEDDSYMNITLSGMAAAHGHTLTAASNMLIVEPPWTPADYRQITDRIHRIGQDSAVVIHNMSAPNTMDEYVYNTLLRKLDSTDRATSKNLAVDLAEALTVAGWT